MMPVGSYIVSGREKVENGVEVRPLSNDIMKCEVGIYFFTILELFTDIRVNRSASPAAVSHKFSLINI